MSELRLSDRPSSAFLAQFDPERIDIHLNDGIARITVGPHQFEVALPTDGQTVRPEHIAVAREVLGQITDLDAIATREIDGTEEDGELFVLNILSIDEIDLRYSAMSWNSDWCEMFRRQSDGKWAHYGVRKHV